MHVGQMAKTIEESSQMDIPIGNPNKTFKCSIKHDLGQSKAIDKTEAIITSPPNRLTSPPTQNPTPTSSAINSTCFNQNAKSSFNPKEKNSKIQILRQRHPLQMENIPPLHPHEQPQIIYAQPPQAKDYQPTSWMELGLMGHALSFTVPINGQETIVIFHNIQYLSQLIMGGMRLAMNNYLNQVWLNNVIHPMAPSLNPQMDQTMREQWNMPPQFNPMHPLNAPLDLPFFPMEMYTHLNPIFLPWDVNLGNQGMVPPTTTSTPTATTRRPHTRASGGRDGGGRCPPKSSLRANPRTLKPRWNKNLSLRGEAQEKGMFSAAH